MERTKIYGEKNKHGIHLLCLQERCGEERSQGEGVCEVCSTLWLQSCNPQSDIFQFPSDDKPDERIRGIELGSVQMKQCERMWIFGTTITEGMEFEI